MDEVPLQELDVEALHALLGARLAMRQPLVVKDVVRAFLEVSSLPCDKMLCSLEFAFDEDEDRIARLEARFVDGNTPVRSADELGGYEVQILLPRFIPARAAGEGAAASTSDEVQSEGNLVARFVRALADLGAYRTIEALETRAITIYRL